MHNKKQFHIYFIMERLFWSECVRHRLIKYIDDGDQMEIIRSSRCINELTVSYVPDMTNFRTFTKPTILPSIFQFIQNREQYELSHEFLQSMSDENANIDRLFLFHMALHADIQWNKYGTSLSKWIHKHIYRGNVESDPKTLDAGYIPNGLKIKQLFLLKERLAGNNDETLVIRDAEGMNWSKICSYLDGNTSIKKLNLPRSTAAFSQSHHSIRYFIQVARPLVSLDVTSVLSEDCIQAIIECIESMETLRDLKLRYVMSFDLQIKRIFSIITPSNISSLTLDFIPMDVSEYAALSRMIVSSNLTELHLFNTFPDLNQKTGLALLSSVARSNIDSFSIVRDDAGSTLSNFPHAMSLLSMPLFKMNGLSQFDISGNDLSFIRLAPFLGQICRHDKLRVIRISKTNISPVCLEHFIWGIERSNISHLEMKDIVIGEHSVLLFNTIGSNRNKILTVDLRRSVLLATSYIDMKRCLSEKKDLRIKRKGCFHDQSIQKLFDD